MNIGTYYQIIILCSLIILSYFFNLLSKWLRIPSVLLLLATGIGLKYIAGLYGIELGGVGNYVSLFGTVGLIMILLEASLDLKLLHGKAPIISKSLLSAFLITGLSSVAIAFGIKAWFDVTFLNGLIYAIPLSIISSAIVIPSVGNLSYEKKEFAVYESSFSDIIGIILFNFFAFTEIINLNTVLLSVTNILIAVVISVVAALLLIYLVTKIKTTVKYFLLFAVLMLLYTIGKLYHLPALILIIAFGIIMCNAHFIIHPKTERFFKKDEMTGTVTLLKSITAETSFLIRTFFFILFGYSFDLNSMLDPNIIIIGTVIVIVLLVVRAGSLKLIFPSKIIPEVFLMPRGLITILLFYVIPVSKQIQGFKDGILFFVIISTSLIMMAGLMGEKRPPKITTPKYPETEIF